MRIPERAENEYPFLVRIIMWAQKKKYGKALEPAKLWGRSPKLLYGLQAFYRAIDRSSSPLKPSLRALINIKVSQINSCSFCVDIGSALLLKRGISMEKVQAVSEYKTSQMFSEKERVALEYAEAITRYDIGVTDEIFQRLKVHFKEDEIIELTGLIGYQNLASKFNAALDVPPQGFCLTPPASSRS